MRASPKPKKWVALTTFVDDDAGMFYEAGGVYDHEPHNKAFDGARTLQPTEHLTVCPRCAHQFAATDENTAEAHRDLHFDGDADIPSICRQLPTQRPRLVAPGA